MSTGLFPIRQGLGGPRRGYIPKNRRVRLDEFADMLAEEVSPEEAAERLGYSRSYGRVMLGRIKAKLGDQAA